jgi:hypothetical protein
MIRRAQLCIDAGGNHFKHLLWWYILSAFAYCINFCICAMLRTRATFSWLPRIRQSSGYPNPLQRNLIGNSLTAHPPVLLDCIVCLMSWTVLCALVCFQRVCMEGLRKYTISHYSGFLSWILYQVPSEYNWNSSTLNMEILMSSETLVFIYNITRRSSDTVLMIFSPISTSNLTIETLHLLDNMLSWKCDNVADIM